MPQGALASCFFFGFRIYHSTHVITTGRADAMRRNASAALRAVRKLNRGNVMMASATSSAGIRLFSLWNGHDNYLRRSYLRVSSITDFSPETNVLSYASACRPGQPSGVVYRNPCQYSRGSGCRIRKFSAQTGGNLGLPRQSKRWPSLL